MRTSKIYPNDKNKYPIHPEVVQEVIPPVSSFIQEVIDDPPSQSGDEGLSVGIVTKDT